MSMKRNRETLKTMAADADADCLLLLSHQGEIDYSLTQSTRNRTTSFVCKTCNREFSSFQALGGHRASHKKPRLLSMGGDNQILEPAKSKSKPHECSICGLEFAIGQALGGHMRRHRAIMMMNTTSTTAPSKASVPVFRRSNSKRIVSLDLNFAPGLEFSPIQVDFLANIKSPVIHSFI